MAERQDRRRRRMRRRRLAQKRFTEPLTAKRAGKIAQRQTNVAYRPVERQVQGEIRGSARQGRQLGNWYGQFAKQLEKSRQATAQAYEQANDRIASTMQTAGQADTKRQQDLQSNASQRQGTTGAPSSPQTAQQRVEAARQSGLFGSALAAPVAGQAANTFGFQSNQANYARREGLQQRLDERQRRRGLQEDLKALRREKGAYRTSKVQELRQSDRDYDVQRAAFGLDRRKQKHAEAEGQFERGLARRDEGRKDRELGLRERELRQEGRRVQGRGGRTRGERVERRDQRRNAVAATQRTIKANGIPSTPKEWAGLEALVSGEEGVPPEVAAWAIARLRPKYERRRRRRERKQRESVVGTVIEDVAE